MLLLVAAGVTALVLALTLGGDDPVRAQSFRSAPALSPPEVRLSMPTSDQVAPGLVFLAPKEGEAGYGPMIIDNEGEMVWFRQLAEGVAAADFEVQTYRGEQVLTWWQGEIFEGGYGKGEFLVMDDSYRVIARVEAGNGLRADLHELTITPQGTALLPIYRKVSRDLSAVGGPEDGVVFDGVIQEVDIETGEVLFQWSAVEHIGLDESYQSVPEESGEPYDFFHINAVHLDRDGNLLVTARHTHGVYKIDRETGDVIWRLGGKESDFEMGRDTIFLSQHDAQRRPDGTLSLFDNHAPPRESDGDSRGLVLDLDERRMTATLDREYVHPVGWLAVSQGNMQNLPGGNVFVGWGEKPSLSEFSEDGRMLFDARLPDEYDSYRGFRFPWTGRPARDPAVAAERSGSEVTVYASWNGATEVAEWQVLAGQEPGELRPVGSRPRTGFETALTVETDQPLVAVRALNQDGDPMATSELVAPDE